jgi:deoxyribonuclease-4
LVRGALARADEIGAEVVQIVAGNPRGWAETPFEAAADDAFRAACALRGVPVFVHTPYLLNFGSPSAVTLSRSCSALAFALRRADALGASGVVLHAGWAAGGRHDDAVRQVREHVLPLLDGVRTRLLIEPTAGGGGALASTVDSVAEYLDVLDDERVGVCLDTCHLHAAGHDLSTRTGMTRTLAALGRAIGRRRIGLVHVNDSRDPAGSKRDRHICLGGGTIGLEPFASLFSSPTTRGVPLVVETAEDDHASDIAALKLLRG